jgi:hypothetical protein
MARALDLRAIAEEMISLGLAVEETRIDLHPELRQLCREANTATLVAIARLVLGKMRPVWITSATDGLRLQREYIPSDQGDALAWLGDELEPLLLDAGQAIRDEEGIQFRRRFGAAAELIVLAAKRLAGADPLHVSSWSDTYGYDIECRQPLERIEVKAATTRTRDVVNLSRNEFEKSRRYGAEWRLVQVVFAGAAFLADRVGVAHVEEVRELRIGALDELIPPDTDTFRWTESAEVRPRESDWQDTRITLDSKFFVDGFGQSR